MLHFLCSFQVYTLFLQFIFSVSIKPVLNIYWLILLHFSFGKDRFILSDASIFQGDLDGYDLNYAFSRERVDPLNVAFVYLVEVVSYSIFW